jgi:hypothetical protein
MKQTDKQIEINTPIELLQFFDVHFDEMSDEDIQKILDEVLGGIWFVSFITEKYKLSEVKLLVGATLADDFSKEKYRVFMRPFGALDEKILAPLNRPTTPQQVEYLKWVWNRKTGNWFKNSDYEGIEYPAPVKKYLGMK